MHFAAYGNASYPSRVAVGARKQDWNNELKRVFGFRRRVGGVLTRCSPESTSNKESRLCPSRKSSNKSSTRLDAYECVPGRVNSNQNRNQNVLSVTVKLMCKLLKCREKRYIKK